MERMICGSYVLFRRKNVPRVGYVNGECKYKIIPSERSVSYFVRNGQMFNPS